MKISAHVEWIHQEAKHNSSSYCITGKVCVSICFKNKLHMCEMFKNIASNHISCDCMVKSN